MKQILAISQPRKQQLWCKLNALNVKEENQPLTEEEKLEKAIFRSKLEKTALLEEISWTQKSSVVLKGGGLQYEVFS